MYRRAVASLFLILAAVTTAAQTPSVPTQTPTSGPTVTAENEPWFLRGEPITFDGSFYYPAGATAHFNRGEMARSGFYRGIPLYSRTTIEPFSVIYVPIGGSLMQPYERPRFGEIAGTVGSRGSAFPVPLADTRRILTDAPQAPSAPTMLPETIAERTVGTDMAGTPPLSPEPVGTAGAPAPVAAAAAAPSQDPRPVGTTGRSVVMPRPRAMETVLQSTGVNGIYVEFDGARWFSSGTAVTFVPAAFHRIGEYRGFAVYTRAGGDAATVFIPTTRTSGLVAPYSRRDR